MSPTETHAKAEAAAATWARTWFVDPAGRDVTNSRGSGSGPAMLIEAYERLLGVALSLVSVRTDRGRTPLPVRLKRLGLDRPIRAWGVRLAAVGRGSQVKDAPITFVAELATPSSLEPMMAVAQALPPERYSVRAADPRAYRQWARSAGRNLAPLTVGLLDEARTFRAARRDAGAIWQSLVQSPPAFELDGKDVTDVALAALRPLVLRSMPWLAVEREALRRSLAESPPEVAVVASDQHRIGRLVVEEMHALGRPVVVLQHGLPQHDLGYLPVSADAVAVWSQSSRRWFEEHGTAKDRLVVLGNPRFDRLLALDRDTARRDLDRRLGLGGGPRILVPLSGTTVEVNARLVHTAVDAVGQMPHASLVIKLHPGLRQWHFVTEIVASLPTHGDRVRVLHHDAIHPLLRWADVTFVHRSSVGLESLVAGTPVLASAMGMSIVEDLPRLHLPVMPSPEALAAIASELAGAEASRRYFFERQQALEDAAGPLDGQTCQRVSRYLLRLAQDHGTAGPTQT